MRLQYGRSPRWLAAASVLVVAACSDSTGPALDRAPAPAFPLGPTQAQYSLGSANPGTWATAAVEGASGSRWCASRAVWFDPSADGCGGRSQAPPFGEVTMAGGEIQLAAGRSQAAPFLWTGPPGRENPFPESGDFTLDLRVKVDQIAGYGTGVRVLEWDPARTEGANTPLRTPVLQIWADRSGLRVFVPGALVRVPGALFWHSYRLTYEDGQYTLFVDGEYAAGPVTSVLRPSAVWMGNPIFVEGPAGDWSDFRVAQLTVSTPAAEVMEVPVDVKPGGCPSPVNLRGRGMVPVAILGTSELDVTRIDPTTVALAGVGPVRHAYEDVGAPAEPYVGKGPEDCSAEGPDGIMDLTLKFDNAALVAALEGVEVGEPMTLSLTGMLRPEEGGTTIAGEDVVVVRGK